MLPLTLYCKSYRTDLLRVVRLVQSVEQFNTDRIPFYISVPRTDFSIFKDHLAPYQTEVIEDESILSKTPYSNNQLLRNLPGRIGQQVIKSEYWRLNISSSYVCLDSDAQFIRQFNQKEFLSENSIPYTVIDEAHDHLESCLHKGRSSVIEDFQKEAQGIQSLFGRSGRSYSFGPFPLIWHRAVWESLEEMYLQPNSLNYLDAIIQFPMESRWYGEALLKYHAIPLVPCQSLFKVYHFAWQLDQDKRRGVSQEHLGRIYSGVIYQSAWERELDWPREGGSMLSRLGRRVRRGLGKI